MTHLSILSLLFVQVFLKINCTERICLIFLSIMTGIEVTFNIDYKFYIKVENCGYNESCCLEVSLVLIFAGFCGTTDTHGMGPGS
jgi:hypothetical protein